MGEGILIGVAAAVGTPVYVYDAEKIRTQYAALRGALAGVPHRLHYSVKANANLAVLKLLRGLGAGADIVSGGELARALRAGFQGGDLVFSGVGKTERELEAALNAGVGLINLESHGEFQVLRRLARGRPAPVSVGLRINPDVTTETHPYTRTGQAGMKFGVPLDQVLPLARCVAAERDLVLTSVGMHLGSQIADGAPYRAGAERLASLVAELRAAGLDSLTSVDVGGGLGISYGRGEGLDPTVFAAAVTPLARATGLPLLIEPGRFLVGNAGYLLTRVLYHKRSGGREFLITDAGMNDLLRPSLYQAYHEIVVLAAAVGGVEAAAAADGGVADVVGPNCESGDFLALDRRLDGAGPGALLAVLGAGAYGFGMSFHYNSRPRSAEVLVDGGRYAVIREREGADDLMRGETVTPAWRDA
ncbi:MAG: diaminopimelate decarboxylase [Gemmatimonadetes bacterium]|nr:diaminopimelate decarboxylase [Gemmatimonadota bacterium]